MLKKETLIMGILIGVFALSVLVGSFSGRGESSNLKNGSSLIKRDAVAVIPVFGVIRVEESEFIVRSGIDAVTADLEEFGRRADVKAVVLRVNSPGGTVGSSQELFQVIKQFKKDTKKPVYVSVVDYSASGAYWISMAADKIYAHPGSLVGSLGVIIRGLDLTKVKERYAIGARVYKAGEMKDILNPWREPTQAEKEVIQTMLDNIHQQFIQTLINERGITEEQARDIADGRIYSGSQALELGLIDALGGLDDAIHDVALQAGIKGDPRVVRPEDIGFRDFMKSLRSTFSGVNLKGTIFDVVSVQ